MNKFYISPRIAVIQGLSKGLQSIKGVDNFDKNSLLECLAEIETLATELIEHIEKAE